jgi:tetratricopeptide (TPR) repeat protein
VRTRSGFVIASLLLLLVGRGLWAAEQNDFAKADQAYSEGRYEEAAAGYQAVVGSGHWNANVFYNLGNAYYRLGKFGQAIVNYERALALEPRHPEADANLRLARDEARALELRKDLIERYAGIVTVKQWSIAAAAGFWLALFVAAHLVFTRRRSAGRISLVALGLVLSAVSVFAIMSLENGTSGRALAIVTGQNVVARIATADSAQSVLALPAGSAIKVLSERGDWLYAALPNDQNGWIPAGAVERVRM